jgi:hypothetical protein
MTEDFRSEPFSTLKARRAAALAKLARDNTDNDRETLVRVTCPQDVYDAINLLRTRSMDHLDPNSIEESPITAALARFLDEISTICLEIKP